MEHEFVLRSMEGISVHYGSPAADPTSFAQVQSPPFAHLLKGSNYSASCLSADGSLLAWVADSILIVVDIATGSCLLNVYQPAEEMIFSPAKNFLAVWHKGHFAREKPQMSGITSKDIRLLNQDGGAGLEVQRMVFTSSKVEEEQREMEQMMKNEVPRENLVVFNLGTGTTAATFFQREYDFWKPQWSIDDEICIRVVTNNIHVYRGKSFDAEKLESIFVERIETAAMFPKSPYTIATFVPEKKDQPAVVNTFELATPEKIIATKSFFRAKEAMLHWCFDGSAVLAHTIDNGEHGLYLVNRGIQSKVILDAGAIQLIKWSPTIRQFLIVYNSGRKMAIFNIECDIAAAFDEGVYRKELVSFSPNGKMVSMCRIGNDQKLTFEIHDVKTKGLVYSLETAKQLSFVEWAPSSAYFVIGSHVPLVNKDNGLSVFNLAGKSICAMKVNSLARIEWRNLPPKKGASASGSQSTSQDALSPEDEKKLKKLRQKLKEIEELKDKDDLGLELEDNQRKKILTEAQTLKDIEAILKKTKN